ncbi:MAG TPA: hypothetical protein VIJ38_02705 [Acidobacteriaceae bacterium]
MRTARDGNVPPNGLSERLLPQGFLQQVLKGWLIPSRPDDATGESTVWYASYWQFCAIYLRERFGTEWCLSPE